MFLNSGTPLKSRRFEYQYRYYKPEEDKKRKIEFHRIRKSSEPQRGSLLRLAIIVILLVIVFIYMGKKGFHPSSQSKPEADVLKVEEIIVVD